MAEYIKLNILKSHRRISHRVRKWGTQDFGANHDKCRVILRTRARQLTSQASGEKMKYGFLDFLVLNAKNPKRLLCFTDRNPV